MDKVPTDIDQMSGPPGIINPTILETSSARATEPPRLVQGSVGSLNISHSSQPTSGLVSTLTQSQSQIVVTSTVSQTPQTTSTNVVNGLTNRPLINPVGQQPPHVSIVRDSSLGSQVQAPIISSVAPEMSSNVASQSLSQMDGSIPNSTQQDPSSLSQQESRAKQQSARRCAINFLKIYYRTLSANSKDLLRYYDLNACVDRISCGEFQNDDMTGMSLQSVRNILRNFGSVLRVTIKLIDYQYSRDDNVIISVHGAMQFGESINPTNIDDTNGAKRSGGSHLVPPGTDVGFLQIFYLTRNSKGWWVIQNDIFRLMNDGHVRMALQPNFVTVPQPMDTMLGLGGHGQLNDGPRLNGGSSPLQNSMHTFSPSMHSVGTSRSMPRTMMTPTHTTSSTQTNNQTALGSEFSSDGQFRRSRVNPIIHGPPPMSVDGGSDRARSRRIPRVNHNPGTGVENSRRRPPVNEVSGHSGHSVPTSHSGSGTPRSRSGRRGSSGSLSFPFSNPNGSSSGSTVPAAHRPPHQRPVSSHGQSYPRQTNGQFENFEFRSQRPRAGGPYFGGPSRGNSRHGARSSPDNGIFVKLETEATQDELRGACREFGEIENVQIFADKKFAFVFFKSQDGMMRAVSEGKCMLRGVEHGIQKKKPQKERDSFRFHGSGGEMTYGSAQQSSRRGHRTARGSGHDNSSRPSSKSRSRQGDRSTRETREPHGREREPSRQSRVEGRDRRESRSDQGRGKQGKPSRPNSNSSTSGSSPKKGPGKKSKTAKQSSQSQSQSRDREKGGNDHLRVAMGGDGESGHSQKENINSENIKSPHHETSEAV